MAHFYDSNTEIFVMKVTSFHLEYEYLYYCIKALSHIINSHVLTSTNPCINKAIHMLLMHGFAVLHISIPRPSQKLMSSSVTCTEANIIS